MHIGGNVLQWNSSFQIVLENSSREDKHECPFGRSSIELTKMLCEILKVGELREYLKCFFTVYQIVVSNVTSNLPHGHTRAF